jgi:hypothetical protein
MRIKNYRKMQLVEAQIGCTIPEYIKRAAHEGKSQRDMADELKVQPVTMGRWIEQAGFEQVLTYRKRTRVV